MKFFAENYLFCTYYVFKMCTSKLNRRIEAALCKSVVVAHSPIQNYQSLMNDQFREQTLKYFRPP